MAEKGEIVVKRWDFRGLKQVMGLLKRRASNPNRKAKWCKMQVLLLKTAKTNNEKSQK